MLNWGYAVTDHVTQGRIVTGGRAVTAGTEDRQHAYVALSCGTDTNMAARRNYCQPVRVDAAQAVTTPG
jgi:hypothetical protein